MAVGSGSRGRLGQLGFRASASRILKFTVREDWIRKEVSWASWSLVFLAPSCGEMSAMSLKVWHGALASLLFEARMSPQPRRTALPLSPRFDFFGEWRACIIPVYNPFVAGPLVVLWGLPTFMSPANPHDQSCRHPHHRRHHCHNTSLPLHSHLHCFHRPVFLLLLFRVIHRGSQCHFAAFLAFPIFTMTVFM